MTRSCLSEPHGGGWGEIFGEDGLGLAFKDFIQQDLNRGFGDASIDSLFTLRIK